MASLEDSHVNQLVHGPFCNLALTNNRRLTTRHQSLVLCKDDRLDFPSIHEGKAQEQQHNGDEVLPPVAFTVPFEKDAEAAECQMVQKV